MELVSATVAVSAITYPKYCTFGNVRLCVGMIVSKFPSYIHESSLLSRKLFFPSLAFTEDVNGFNQVASNLFLVQSSMV